MGSSTVSFLVTRLVHRVPFKVICIITLVIPVIPIMVEYHYKPEGSHTPSSMCSPRYPGYSRLLDMPVTLPHGGVQAEGWQYPPGAVWWDSRVAHGCPCSVGPCIRPCCPNGSVIVVTDNLFNPNRTHDSNDEDLIVCTDKMQITEEPEIPPPLVLSLAEHRMVSTSRRHFPVLEANCDGRLAVEVPLTLTTDGQVMEQEDGILVDPTKYGICFNMRDGQLKTSSVYQCPRYHSKDIPLQKVRIAILFTVGLSTVIVLLVFTLVTYLLVPRLLPSHCGGSVLSYISALLAHKTLYIICFWSEDYYPDIFKYSELVENSSFVSILMWQVLIVYQMWTTFSPHRMMVPYKGGGSTKFIWYSVAIWGTAVFTTLWSNFSTGTLFHLYLGSLVALITLYLNASAIVRLRACLKASMVTQGPDSHRHNTKEYQWTSLFLKFSFLTSLEYTLIILFTYFSTAINGTHFAYDSPLRHLYVLLKYLQCLRGVEIFVINVCNERTWAVLRARFGSQSRSIIRNT